MERGNNHQRGKANDQQNGDGAAGREEEVRTRRRDTCEICSDIWCVPASGVLAPSAAFVDMVLPAADSACDEERGGGLRDGRKRGKGCAKSERGNGMTGGWSNGIGGAMFVGEGEFETG